MNTMKFTGGKNMKNRINDLREHLHQAVKSKNTAEVLKISQELDELIIEYFKQESLAKEDGD